MTNLEAQYNHANFMLAYLLNNEKYNIPFDQEEMDFWKKETERVEIILTRQTTDDTVDQLIKECDGLMERIDLVNIEIKEILVGRKAKIVSRFNGQLHGHSKKPKTGKVLEIEEARFSMGMKEINVLLKNQSVYMSLDEIEII